MARTSDRVSRLASRYARLTPETLHALSQSVASREATAEEIRSMAASLLAQDEHKGLRGILKRIGL